ncbi:MAG: glutamyl-tRNA reductase [Proteobacteria bacterium]|nr:glutamyl-tRNA reductase [Pseudomonadota bacterium]
MQTNLAEYFQNNEHEIFIAGLNHTTADIKLREKFNLSTKDLQKHKSYLRNFGIFEETVVISTCNRIELVAVARKKNSLRDLESASYSFFEQVSSLDRKKFKNNVYFLPQKQAIAHLYSVVSGVDSLIPGEPQIFGQVKEAYHSAKEKGDVKYFLNKLFNSAFHVAKKVRSQTGISQKAVSVCYAAKELVGQIYGDLSETKVLLIGAGETGQLVAKYLQAAGVNSFFIANRTFSKAYSLATKFSSTAITFDQIATFLKESDIIIGAAQYDKGFLLSAQQVEVALQKRKNKQQLFIDLSVPRNFDDKIENIANTFLYNIDDLDKVIAQNIDARKEELVHAKSLIEEEATSFYQKFCNLNVEHCIASLFRKIEIDTHVEVNKTIKNLKRLDIEDSQLELIRPYLDKFASALTAKILHQPLTTFKDTAIDDEAAVRAFLQYFVRKD